MLCGKKAHIGILLKVIGPRIKLENKSTVQSPLLITTDLTALTTRDV